MMIRLNLLEEERAIRQAREHDPVRVAILLAVLVLILAAVAGVFVSYLKDASKEQAAAKKTAWSQKEKDQASAQRDLDELAMIGKRQETIDKIQRKRFLYAPQLQAIKESIPEGVQLVKMSFGQETAMARNPDLDNPKMVALAKEKGRQVPPEKQTKRMALLLEGFVTGENPQQSIDQFVGLLNSAAAAGSERHSQIPLTAYLEYKDGAILKDYKIQKARTPPSGTAAATPEVGRFQILCRYRS